MKGAGIWIGGATAVVLALALGATDGTPAGNNPQFTSDGRLMRPLDYREWVFLSSGLGMTYGPLAAPAPDANPRFDNVFVTKAAYRSFLEAGRWPDKTMFVLEVRSSRSKGSINKGGHFQSDLEGIEAEVKDEHRYPGKWAFFSFGDGDSSAKPRPATDSCYSCHAQNGAVDNTFVQFYPTLLPIAKQKGTLRSGAAEAGR